MMNDKKIDVKNFEYLNIETNGIKVPVITATGSTYRDGTKYILLR